MIHVPFGDGLLLPSTLLHSGHYGSRSNLRFHGVLSTGPWSTEKLCYVEKFVRNMYNDSSKKIHLSFTEDYDIDALCPLCFRRIGISGECTCGDKCKMRCGNEIGMNSLSGKYFVKDANTNSMCMF